MEPEVTFPMIDWALAANYPATGPMLLNPSAVATGPLIPVARELPPMTVTRRREENYIFFSLKDFIKSQL